MWVDYLEGCVSSMKIAAGVTNANGDTQWVGYPLKWNKQAVQTLRPIIPYCLHSSEEPTGKIMIWLNRSYKPIGTLLGGNLGCNGWVSYMDYPNVSLNIDESGIKDLIREKTYKSGNGLYLFNDYSAPWNSKKHSMSYLKILEDIIQCHYKQESAKLEAASPV